MPSPAPTAPANVQAASTDASVQAAVPPATPTETPDAAPPPPPPPPLPVDRVHVESPYKLYERPRPAGQVAAAGADEILAKWNVGGTGDPNFVSNRKGYHPGARVRVDTQPLSAGLPKRLTKNRRTGRYPNVLSETSLLARSRKYGYWPFRLCFEDGLREDAKLGGKTVLRLVVDGRGRVTSARVQATKLDDKFTAQCLEKRVRTLSFPPPPRGRKIGVEMTIALWPGDAPVSRIGPPRGEVFDNAGELKVENVHAALSERSVEVARCYAEGLERDPALWGRVAFRLDVSERGKLGPVREYESHFPDSKVRRCIATQLRSLDLGVPTGGAVSIVAAYRLGSPPTIAAETTLDSQDNTSQATEPAAAP